MSIHLEEKEWSSTYRYFGCVFFEGKTYNFELVCESMNNVPLGVNSFTRIYFIEPTKTSLKKKLRKHIQSELIKDDYWKEKINFN